ncbi:uncharacterized protein LOC110459847 [Mizuhopecten yessoensis]|uniref:Zinc finger protein 318 n=1 Tax=Mizuhopecten yessoensis TaxID=6573 RepID=A0A210Q3U5_MIZYE|nr:uncharacterized protein LOC110459847 [Mizuhopecten yessoensis]OWF43349.1 Zinc finger protein 318 [Mizuhopecten yessoensis]
MRGRIDKYSGEDRYKGGDTSHRRGGSIDRREDNRGSLERQSGYREPESDAFFRDINPREDSDNRTERELLGGYRDLQSRDDYQNITRRSSDELRPSFPLIPPAPKPLKSILKKKSAPEDSLPGQVTNPVVREENNLFPIIRSTADRQVADTRTQQNTEKSNRGTPFDDRLPRSEGRGSSRSGLPGMSSYMDIEDEEKFLYGDDDHDEGKDHSNKSNSQRPSTESRSRSQDSMYTGVDNRCTRPDSYSADDHFNRMSSTDEQRIRMDSQRIHDQRSNLDSRLMGHEIADQPIRPTAEEQLHSSVSSFLEDQRFKHNSYPPALRDTVQVQENPVAIQPPGFKPDLLSLFTSGNELPKVQQPTQTVPPIQQPIQITPTLPYTSQVPPEEPKQKYDPTIENILKSIGFDFEMSRRMQEKASNSLPIQKPKKDEEQFGINQTASFLEGGISNDIKNKLFNKSKKEESIVDILMREAREGPSRSTEKRHDRENEPRERYKKMEPKSSEQDRRLESYKRERDTVRDADLLDRERKKELLPAEPVKESASDLYEESTYEDPSLSTESLSSGISFQRHVTPTEPQYPAYSQPASYSQPGYPPDMANYTNSPVAPPTQVHPGAVPPYPGAPMGAMYNAPPQYGYGHPPQGFDQGSYPNYTNYPPQGAPFQPRHNPPNLGPPPHGQAFHGPPPNVPSLRGPPPPPHGLPPQMRVSMTTDHQSSDSRTRSARLSPVKDTLKEEIQEKKTITIEKKTITISPKETNRTVIPPNLDRIKGPEKQPTDPPPKLLTPKERNIMLKESQQRRQKIETLESELQILRKQQNEMMRKIRRQKDGHKDPVLIQNNKLQDDISAQLSKLRKAAEENSKILKEYKVDPNLQPDGEKEGTSEADAKTNKPLRNSQQAQNRKKNEPVHQVKKYEFFDPGGYWCKVCNTDSGSVYSVLQHLHGKKHQQAMNPYDRPWVPRAMKSPSKRVKNEHLEVLPVKGQEFLVPCKAFYCTLCKEFAGDEACADFHIKTDSHYQNYLKHLEKNEFYEQRMGLDKAAGRSGSKDMKNVKKEDRKEDRREKNEQKRQRVQEKEKVWEKPVTELDLEQPAKKPKMSPSEPKDTKAVKSGEGFGKFTFTPVDKDKGKKEADNDEEQEKKENESGQDSKSKIAINIVNKMGIKPVPGAKISGKKNPLLPPWTPVSKQESQKLTAGVSKVEAFPLRKGSGKTEHAGGKPSSLDMFLTIEDKSKPLPVMKDKPKVTAQDILKAFTGKLKDDNASPAEKKNQTDGSEKTNASPAEKKNQTDGNEKTKLTCEQKEELEDLKMLGIDPIFEKPLAEKKVPPPPSQNLSLPPSQQTQVGVADNPEKGKLSILPMMEMDIPLPPSAPSKAQSVEKVAENGEVKGSAISTELPMDQGDIVPTPAKSEEVTQPTAEIKSSVAELEDVNDGASDCSGYSMHMGSDFEVVDECEADEL